MRTILILGWLLLASTSSMSQILTPVKWSFSSRPAANGEYELIFTAKIDEGWSVYSQHIEGDDGPVPTTFYFNEGTHFKRIGQVTELPENRKTVFDEIFQMQVTKFKHKATFIQKVKVIDPSKPITGYLEFMTCDDTRCLPPEEVEFSFDFSNSTAGKSASADDKEAKTTANGGVGTPTNTDESKTTELPFNGNTFGNKATASSSGIENPVQWGLALEPLQGNEYRLKFKARLDEGWYIYSQHLEPGGPEPTVIEFEAAEEVKPSGPAREISNHKYSGYDELFGMNVTKYKEEVEFEVVASFSEPNKTYKGMITYMVCNDEKCIPGDVSFEVNPGGGSVVIGNESADTGEVVSAVDIGNGFVLDKSMASDCGLEVVDQKGKGLWGIFLLGFLGGLLALLTPCVFPMIPLTVSFFTKGSENKKKGILNASMYGFFILLVYLLLSLPFHLLDSVNPDILNEISTNVWLNLFFFVIFLVFAFSFFGYYELTLPSSWANKVSAAEGVGGMVGIFFMALTLALVSFSCTGPILGSLLAGTLSTANGEGAMQLSAGMAGFGLALALPFALFAAFPSWLSSLPRSGGWMTTVKVVLGFLELALAFKFLSNADLVKHWGLLKIEPFLAIWILIFIGMGLYLLGKIRFPHDSPPKKLHPARLITALASFAFAIYLATGFIYDDKMGSLRPLKLLSGLAPPACYSIWYPCECPQNLNCFKDFETGLAYARKMNKPIMIDFTGHACVNCRKMEEHVWPDPRVYKLLRDEFVLISLYVDEKIDLPESEQLVVKRKNGGTRKLRTTGQKWQHFQTEYFDINSQPFYVLISPDGKLLNQPTDYTPDAEEYARFLSCGLKRFKELQGQTQMLGSLE